MLPTFHVVEKERNKLQKEVKLSEPQLSLSKRHRKTSKENEALEAYPMIAEKKKKKLWGKEMLLKACNIYTQIRGKIRITWQMCSEVQTSEMSTAASVFRHFPRVMLWLKGCRGKGQNLLK